MTMKRTITRHALHLWLLASLAACGEETGYRSIEDSGTDALRQLRYTPEGCDYEVETPEVADTSLGADESDADASSPDHIHVSWAGPSQSTFAVNWRTAVETKGGFLLYGTDEAAVAAADGPTDAVQLQHGHTLMYEAGLGTLLDDPSLTTRTRIHEVHVCGLEPDTVYYYKVGLPGTFSEVFDVSTAPVPGSSAPWAFAVTGDSRNHQENAWAISQRRIRELGAELQLFSGDAVVIGAIQGDWDQFFSVTDDAFSVQDLLARTPLMPVNGNHDALAVNYVAQFALPQHRSPGERAQGKEWYSFDYGNAHFVMLNDSVDDNAVISGAQADWMRQDLGAVDREKTPWVFAVHHRPFHTCLSTHSPDTSLRAAWQPIFDEFEVDIVFNGHNHVYERSVPIRGLEGGQGVLAPAGANGVPVITDGRPSGTLYVVSAGVGAPMYPVSSECAFTQHAVSERNYTRVELDDRTITVTVRNVLTNAVIDEFSYTK
jgi:acid phosphatase type 7